MTDARTRRVHKGRSALVGVLGAFTLAATLAPAAVAAGTDVGTEVVGGHDATEDYPFMVSLQQQGEHFCGGSLIKPDWVVTAAHCAVGQQPAQISARIGSNDRTTGGTEAGISRIVVHPGYDPAVAGDDVALLKLDKAVDVPPIKIAARSGEAGTPTRIIGWGVTCDDQQQCPELPVRLQELETVLVGDDKCQKFDGASELCTDSPTEGAQGCNGDSGGPQLKGRPGEWELIGSTSRDGDADPACGTGTGVWTDLTTHADWIEQTTAA